MIVHKNGDVLNYFQPSYVGKSIVISIDSSKSNTGMIVGFPDGTIVDDYEISGAGSDIDVYDLCRDTRAFLKEIFKDANIRCVGIEDIITKAEKNKEGKSYKGIDIHKSRAKITAVFDNFMFSFEEFFNIRPIRVNNWAWKADILPEEYRTRAHDKGSRDYFDDLGNRWAGRKDDVTDAVCIFLYLIRNMTIRAKEDIYSVIPPQCEYDYNIVPASFEPSSVAKEFGIYVEETLDKVMATVANNLQPGKIGYFFTNIESVPLSDIYSERLGYSNDCKFEKLTDKVMIIVRRKE